MTIRNVLIVFFILFGTAGYSQQDEKLIQFSGIIRSLKYEPVPDVHIINIRDRTGTTGTENGMFSFIVKSSDSLLFRSIGYKNTLVVIPDSIEGVHYVRDVYMLSDTIHFAEIKVYPWKTYEEFKVAFIKLDLPDDDNKRAARNIALVKAQLNMDFDPDADLSYKYAMQQRYDRLYTIGQYPSISILNPLNWAKFFSSMKKGDYKRED